jgi:hypothetical protein
MNEKLSEHIPDLGGIPEKLRREGIFVHYKEIAKIGDTVEAIVNVYGGEIPKGTRLEIEDIIIDPRGNDRGFEKYLKFKGVNGEFNPKKFKKV